MFDKSIEAITWPDNLVMNSRVGPFHGSADTFFLFNKCPRDRLTLVLTSTQSEASILQRELRFYSGNSASVFTLPDWETLPYDSFSPHRDIISDRLNTLYHLPQLKSGILIISVSTAMHRLPSVDFVRKFSFVLKAGDKIEINGFRAKLTEVGYKNVDIVKNHGEFAIRGSLFDLFPMGSLYPYRVDLLDNEVDSLRRFDPFTQRTVEVTQEARLLPAREFPIDEEGINLFKMNWYRTFDGDPDSCPIYREVSEGRIPAGIEYYLPLFFEKSTTIFDFLPSKTPVITIGDWKGTCRSFWSQIMSRYTEYGIDGQRPFLSPERGFIPKDEFHREIDSRSLLELVSEEAGLVAVETGCQSPPRICINEGMSDVVEKLSDFKKEHDAPILICIESQARKKRLFDSLNRAGFAPKFEKTWQSFLENGTNFGITSAPIDRGLYFGSSQPTLVCEEQLFSKQVAQKQLREVSENVNPAPFKDLNELIPGMPVVHLEHGIGIYLGLEVITIEQNIDEFLSLQYENDSRLYVPVSSFHLISRYSGADQSTVTLSRLGSSAWKSAKEKASQKANDVAAELLDIYAQRESREGFHFKIPNTKYEDFCGTFPFEETPDQTSAIEAVIKDMCSDKVMDRLVCGDVGFGKTEVAMRAAFLASQNEKQTVVLVPTTLLAQQHFSSFLNRFADWSIKIELISRFRSRNEILDIAKKVHVGDIDILIGTHKLLHADFKFKDLGLLIIDEEHRFGVKQKESIKALRTEIDILTLTATPIPRTLNMAFEGIRDLSIITTAPKQRLSIKTFIRESSSSLIKEAIAREILRGGQVFYIHNEVKTILRAVDSLKNLDLDVKIGVAHGQMRESELEVVMSDFYNKKFELLVCTTIIETGIDIPTANTIIIERADKLGLAQLHQLRGRVGRSHHQAYAYLLIPQDYNLGRDSLKRLEAIEDAGELGSGYMLATHDLEIRGAGEILGDDQSGQIQSIGYSLYMRLLTEAIETAKQGGESDKRASITSSTEVNLHAPALIQDYYLPNVNTRLILYRRIAYAKNEAELKQIQIEMIDRFGLLDESTNNLFGATKFRIKAERLGIKRMDIGQTKAIFEFADSTLVSPSSLIERVKEAPEKWKFAGGNKLQASCDLPNFADRESFADDLLNQLVAESKATERHEINS